MHIGSEQFLKQAIIDLQTLNSKDIDGLIVNINFLRDSLIEVMHILLDELSNL